MGSEGLKKQTNKKYLHVCLGEFQDKSSLLIQKQEHDPIIDTDSGQFLSCPVLVSLCPGAEPLMLSSAVEPHQHQGCYVVHSEMLFCSPRMERMII